MENLMGHKSPRTVVIPLRMGIKTAMEYVNRPGRKSFLAWVERNQIPTYRKNSRGDREYITEDLKRAVNAECATNK